MTSEQRYDLFIEWGVTSTRDRQYITEEYLRNFGTDQPKEQEHWEEYLVEALNIKPFCKTLGLV